MTVVAEHPRLTVEDFLVWSEQHPTLRAELIDGEIVAMAPETWRHGEVKGNVWLALRNAIADAGVPCRANVESVGVRIDATTSFIPDVIVACGAPIDPKDTLVEPTIVVEVLSPSTRRGDQTRKLRGYAEVPSIAHYLIIDPDARTVEHFRRTEAGFVVALPTETLTLDPPGLVLAVGDLFDGA